MLNEDYKEMLQILSANEVEFLIVGAYAMGVHGYPRATGDIDLWVLVSRDNSKKVYKSLEQFGAPLEEIDEQTFCSDGVVFQIGVAPRRIDIITHIDGVDFKQAYANKQQLDIGGIKVPVISLEYLIKNKESTGREKDRLDVKYLRSQQQD